MNGTVHNSEILIKLARGTSPSFDTDKVMFAPPRQLIRKWSKLAPDATRHDIAWICTHEINHTANLNY